MTLYLYTEKVSNEIHNGAFCNEIIHALFSYECSYDVILLQKQLSENGSVGTE
jgi:hypothetical protein